MNASEEPGLTATLTATAALPAPASLSTGNATTTSFDVTFDNVTGAQSYAYKLNTSAQGSVTNGGAIGRLLASQLYSVMVRAVDQSGNPGVWSDRREAVTS